MLQFPGYYCYSNRVEEGICRGTDDHYCGFSLSVPQVARWLRWWWCRKVQMEGRVGVEEEDRSCPDSPGGGKAEEIEDGADRPILLSSRREFLSSRREGTKMGR